MSESPDILCFDRVALPAPWLPQEGALPLTWDGLLATLQQKHPAIWLPRTQAEEDPRWKQPIPYVLAHLPDGRLATYQRAGGERRLHGHWSVGIGGHVERLDEGGTLGDTLIACARREVVEELGEAPQRLRFLGVVNEEITAVGRVHWGLVFEARLPQAVDHSPELGPIHWHAPDAIHRPLERWSHLALGLLRENGKLATAPHDQTPTAYSTPTTENEP